jgi:hypothetical protein
MIIVSIKDRAADAFARPFFVQTDNVAIRSFMDEVNRKDADNNLYNHPDDYDLYGLGVFDDNTAIIEMYDAPKLLMLGKTAKTTV